MKSCANCASPCTLPFRGILSIQCTWSWWKQKLKILKFTFWVDIWNQLHKMWTSSPNTTMFGKSTNLSYLSSNFQNQICESRRYLPKIAEKSAFSLLTGYKKIQDWIENEIHNHQIYLHVFYSITIDTLIAFWGQNDKIVCELYSPFPRHSHNAMYVVVKKAKIKKFGNSHSRIDI